MFKDKIVKIFHSDINYYLKIKKTIIDAFKRLNIFSIRDLLFYKPYGYRRYYLSIKDLKIQDKIQDKIQEKNFVSLKVKILSLQLNQNNGKRHTKSSNKIPNKIICKTQDEEILELVFFQKIPVFILPKMLVGSKHNIRGELKINNNIYQIHHPEFILDDKLMGYITPIYHLTYGINNNQIYNYIYNIIEMLQLELVSLKRVYAVNKQDNQHFIDQYLYYYDNLLKSLKLLHFIFFNKKKISLGKEYSNPDILKLIDKNIGFLTNYELTSNQLALKQLNLENKIRNNISYESNKKLQQQIINKLGFTLTDAQARSIKEIEADQSSPYQMIRLLQGDVGSGKTLVALLTMINTATNKTQSALMAPTDLLATQHYNFIKSALEGTDFKVALLKGKTRIKERREILSNLESGDISILIGTHALFQENIKFNKLDYVIVDEQHRFGVNQRNELMNKGERPDFLIMSATPIPRSLSLTIFGNIKVSVLDSKPKNRKAIITNVLKDDNDLNIINNLKNKIKDDEQVYWVCPLIENNKDDDLSKGDIKQSNDIILSDKYDSDQVEVWAHNIQDRFELINKYYQGQVAILHGKMKPQEKDQIMQDFKAKKYKILIATTVIEVGIDVPDATIIIIDNAEKFGLAALHQLRGRVGRGAKQSHCILLYNNKKISKIAVERLNILRKSNDGFYIAKQDLYLRGGGEILGVKQSGEQQFFFASLERDHEKLDHIHNQVFSREKIEFDQPHISSQIKLFQKNLCK